MATKRKRKTRLLYKSLTKKKANKSRTTRPRKNNDIIDAVIERKKRNDIIDAVIERIKKHKLRFDIDYEKGIYDLTPKEADIYDDSIDDIIRIIRKM